jgi:hypothetical protein
MSSDPKHVPHYPENIARCQHIKINGVQCASPALRRHKFCYFHKQYRQKRVEINSNIRRERCKITLPVLEDANSVQMSLAEVMRLLVTQQIDHRTAALLFYGLQTASANLSRTAFQPLRPTYVVIDPDSVAHRPLRATAWSRKEGAAYDTLYYEFEQDEIDDEREEERKKIADAEEESYHRAQWPHADVETSRPSTS